MRYLLIGNYGVGNWGDEALKQFFFERFPDVHWIVVSAHPQAGEVPRLPGGLRSFFSPWWRTIGAYWRADGVVFGGGSLFTDVESVYACFLWWLHGALAVLFRKRLILSFQGIGPFRTGIGERVARSIAKYSQCVIVRDEESQIRVEKWRLNKKIVQSFDPVFSLIKNQKSLERTKKILIVIPRMNSGDKLLRIVAENLQKSHFDEVIILSLEQGEELKTNVFEKIKHLIGQSSPLRISRPSSIVELCTVLQTSTLVITERFHGGIAALALHVPLVLCSQRPGDKIASLQKYVDDAGQMKELSRKILDGETALREALA